LYILSIKAIDVRYAPYSNGLWCRAEKLVLKLYNYWFAKEWSGNYHESRV